MSAVRRTATVVAGALALLAAAAPASAADAERTGWWNRASAGPAALPVPTTVPGDLRVASGADEPSAYAAVLLVSPGSRAATLDLLLRPGTALGTPEVVACPTETTEWPEGGNQPYDAAPAYDCAAGLAFGALSEDGTTLSFVLDDSTQASDGTWSLALVPSPEASAPFAVDLQPPGPAAFQPAPSDAASPEPEAGEPEPQDEPEAPPLLLPGVEQPPAFDTGAAAAPPLLAGAGPLALPDLAAPAAATGPAPAVAPGRRPFVPRPLAVRPVAQALPDSDVERLLALLALVAVSAGVGYVAGQDRPGPRLIGGRASAAASTATASTATASTAATAPPVAGPAVRERGIGRFAKQRASAPRRLR